MSHDNPSQDRAQATEAETLVAHGSAEPAEAPSRHGRFLPGTQFGKRYRIVSLLGKGGMGEVYRADDLQLGQAVALKLLPKDQTHDPAAIARLRSEVRIARRISHPNVCRVHDIGEVDGQYFLSMEHVDGEDLASVLRRMGRPSPQKAIQIACQLCRGLAAAHDNGVLHRDLKPANIMIDGRGRVRITDFGLAEFAEEIRRPQALTGTPAYMAPEQLAGKGVSRRSDIYALGLVLYEVLTGEHAFEARSLDALRKLHDSNPVDALAARLADVDPAVARVILRCLAEDPAHRPSSAPAVAAALPSGDPVADALAAGETPSPEMIAAADGRGRLPRRTAVVLLAATLLACVGFALLNSHTALFRLARLDLPPAALADRARGVLANAGYTETPGDVDYGFRVNHPYLNHLLAGRQADRWRQLSSNRPAVYQFRYRRSPRPMIPSNSPAQITWTDPPQVSPGMARVLLDSSGRLALLEVVPPPPADTASATSRPVDFGPMFASAGLHPADFREDQPKAMWDPLTPTDTRRAWTGKYPGPSGRAVRVEAAACRGRGVYFHLVDSLSQDRETTPRHEVQTAMGRGVEYVGAPAAVLMLIGALLVARYNLRRGRGDRKGAFRLGLFVFVLETLAWVLGADHVARLGIELDLFLRGLGMAMVFALWCGMAYLAVEPYIRRLRPDAMVSWTRLLTGRFRDPLVGRDILIGAVAGVTWVLLLQLGFLVAGWLSLPGGRPLIPPDQVLASGRKVLAGFFDTGFLLYSQYCLFLLVGLLLVVRRRWAAAVAAWAVLTVAMSASSFRRTPDHTVINVMVLNAVCLALVYYVLTRHGLLATVAAWFFRDRLLRNPVTLDTSAWYADTSLLVLGLLAAVVLCAFHISKPPRRRRFDSESIALTTPDTGEG